MAEESREPAPPPAAYTGSSAESGPTSSSAASSSGGSRYALEPKTVPPFVLSQLESFQVSHDQNTNLISGGPQQGNRWTVYTNATRAHDVYRRVGRIDDSFLEKQGDLSGKWVGDLDIKDATSRELSSRGNKKVYKEDMALWYVIPEEAKSLIKDRIHHMLIFNPFIPLSLRAFNLLFSVVALGMACTVYVHSRSVAPSPLTQQPSTIMAIVVQTIAVVYIIYIAYDEFTGRPLGLRDARAKVRLIMLDMLFIILSSANLSLAFNTVNDITWVCRAGYSGGEQSALGLVEYNESLCARQKALAAFLLTGLVMWVFTFAVSVFRLVERVSS